MACVSVVIPSARGVVPLAWTALVKLMQESNCRCGGHEPWACPNGLHSIFLVPHIQSSVIHWARNQMVAQALYGPQPPGRPLSEWFLLMDDDMTPEPSYLHRLLTHKLDIVTGICTVRTDPAKPTIRVWNPQLEVFAEILEWDFASEKLLEIDAAGMAFALVSRKVLEAMSKAYLDCVFERAEDERKIGPSIRLTEYWNKRAERRRKKFEIAREKKDWQGMDCWWFQFFDNISDKQFGEVGEDITWSYKAKKLGFRIYADPQVQPGHIGTYAYSLRDYIACLNDAKATGVAPQEMPIAVPQLKPMTVEAVA